jgi:hypothetical protein
MTTRNPFRIRSFQRASGDEQFVQLFAASALDVLDGTDGVWDALQYLRSAPGGGKTSLLRLMTPGPLRKVAALAPRDPRFKRTAERLTALGALKDNRPNVLGVILSFSNDYSDLDDLGPRSLQVFRALFSARIVLATLRAIIDITGKSFPDDLKTVKAAWTPVDGATIPADADGQGLQEWASRIEDSAYDVLDQLGEEDQESAKAIIGFDGLHWLAAAQFSQDGTAVQARPALLLDELQQLSARQREASGSAAKRSLGGRCEGGPGLQSGSATGEEMERRRQWPVGTLPRRDCGPSRRTGRWLSGKIFFPHACVTHRRSALGCRPAEARCGNGVLAQHLNEEPGTLL